MLLVEFTADGRIPAPAGIVTDLLGMSVFDFLKGNQFAPFPSTHIQSFARQLFTSVACEYFLPSFPHV